MAGDDDRIKLFSSKKCPPCSEAKKILAEKGIPFTVIDVDSADGAKIADLNGIRAIPTIVMGKDMIEGLPSNLKERLNEMPDL